MLTLSSLSFFSASVSRIVTALRASAACSAIALAALLCGTSANAFAAAATTTTLAITAGGIPVSSVPQGTPITLTATVLSGTTPVTSGQVRFCSSFTYPCPGIYVLGTAQLNSAGIATFKTVSTLPISAYGANYYYYEADYVGTKNYTTSPSASVINITAPGTVPASIAISSTAASATSNILQATFVGLSAYGINFSANSYLSFHDLTNGNYDVDTGDPAATVTAFNFANTSKPATPNIATVTTSATADFNGDGIPDLAVAGGTSLTILTGHGDGTFTTGSTYTTGSNPNAIVAADFNGDGKTDLAISNAQSAVTILLGNGDGTFSAGTNPASGTGSSAIALGDFNLDGNLDLIVASNTTSSLTVLLGNGDGTFIAQSPISLSYAAMGVAVADFNGDGIPDIAAVGNSNNATILMGDASGAFAAGSSPAIAYYAKAIVAADLNGDGKTDLAIATNGNTITVLFSKGDGTFTAASFYAFPTGNGPASIAAGDFNADGYTDLIVNNVTDNSATVYLGNGSGNFAAPMTIPGAGGAGAFAAADFNFDGTTDLAIPSKTSASTTNVFLAQYTTTLTFQSSPVSVAGTGTHQIVATYQGNIAYAPTSSPAIGLTAYPMTTSMTFAASPNTSLYGQQVALTATLSPSYAQNHTADGEMVTFYSGSLKLGTTILAGGVATLNTTTIPAGSNALTAVYAGDTNFTAVTGTLAAYNVRNPVATSTTLTITSAGSPVASIPYGTAVTLTASVLAGSTPITAGQVNFCDASALACTDVHLLGTASLNSSGRASLNLSPAIGTHSYKARSRRRPALTGPSASASTSLTVTGTGTLITASTGDHQRQHTGNYSLFGTRGSPSAYPSPTGTISFLDVTNNFAQLAQGSVPSVAPILGWVASSYNHSAAESLADFNEDGIQDLDAGSSLYLGNRQGNLSVVPGPGVGQVVR